MTGSVRRSTTAATSRVEVVNTIADEDHLLSTEEQIREMVNRETRAWDERAMHWIGRAGKAYTLVHGEWKMIFQTGLLDYEH